MRNSLTPHLEEGKAGGGIGWEDDGMVEMREGNGSDGGEWL